MNPFWRTSDLDRQEYERLHEYGQNLDPLSDDYAKLTQRRRDLKEIRNRASEKFKAVASVAGPVCGVVAIWLAQQSIGNPPDSIRNLFNRPQKAPAEDDKQF